MKVVVLLSSGRKTGNTYKVVEEMAEVLNTLGTKLNVTVDFNYIHLPDMNIKPCIGCRNCLDRNETECPLGMDDVKEIRNLILESDGVIATSPVYVNDVTGIMKNFLDRMAYACYRTDLSKKCVYAIATTGSASVGHTLKTLLGAFYAFGMYPAGKAGFITGASMTREEIRKKHGKRIEKAAKAFFTAIHDKKYLNPSMTSLMVFSIRQNIWLKADQLSPNKIFWEQKGWLDPKSTYYFAHKSSPIKTALANIFSSMALWFLKRI